MGCEMRIQYSDLKNNIVSMDYKMRVQYFDLLYNY